MALVCASITGKTPGEFLEAAKGLKADLIELRADGLTECTKEKVHGLLSELKKSTSGRIILTVRMKGEGGRFKGSEEERLDVILGCLHLADLVDIELHSSIRDEVVRAAKANKIEVIISYHDFKGTPKALDAENIITEEMKAGADYAKVAFTPLSPQDVLELLLVTERMSRLERVITISMGELGRISRIAAPFFGSSITYASAGDKTAPGQLTLEETQQVLDMLEVRG